MRLVARYDSKQTRDIVLQTGMEKGAAAGYDKIESMLAKQPSVTLTSRDFRRAQTSRLAGLDGTRRFASGSDRTDYRARASKT